MAPPPPSYTLQAQPEEDTFSNAGPDYSPGSDTQHHRLSAGYTYNTRRSSQSPLGLTSGSPSHKRARHPVLSSSPDDMLQFSKQDHLASRGADPSGTSPTPDPGGRRQSLSVMSDSSYDDSPDTPKHNRRLPPIYPHASSAPSGATVTNPRLHRNSANATRNRRVSFADELSGPQNFTSRPTLEDRGAASGRKLDSIGGEDDGVVDQADLRRNPGVAEAVPAPTAAV
ncbi:MAG: hypothetical protein LQ347_006411 [Umbilicaria vellea]|nr:MAG: hypothetical protein LQ347_006411 [Umbilicaria vellea]